MSDYISREAAFKEFAEFVRDSNNSDFVDAPTWNDAVSLIGSLPAADVAPVVHGKWIDDKSTIIGDLIERNCSLCGQRMTSCIERLMPYCPNCGAKMDLEG